MEIKIAEMIVPADYMFVIVILLFAGFILERFVKPALECITLLFEFCSRIASWFHRKSEATPDSPPTESADDEDERTLAAAEYFAWAKQRQQKHKERKTK